MPTKTSSQVQLRSENAHPLAVHRCRFVDYNPAAITAIAFSPLKLPTSQIHSSKHIKRRKSGKFGPLAVGRSNGNIELYEWSFPPHEQERTPKAPQAWVLRKILYGPNPSKVDSLAFTLRHPHLLDYGEVPSLASLRLFSTGGGSELLEWNIAAGTVLRTLNSQGGAIWSMAVNPANTLLALGCEDGCVRLIDVSGGEMLHSRRFDRVKSRILSIAWGPPIPPPTFLKQHQVESKTDDSDEDEDEEWTDDWLVTGGSDSSLRKWDAKTGRALDRMTTDKVKGERTLVWTVGVLSDGTIISGDSLGVVKFWDSRTCTQLHSFPAHGADVLCMTIGPDGNSVFTSGVDQKVCLFTQVRVSDAEKPVKGSARKSKSRWVQSTTKRMHSHDVRALAVWPPYLPISNSIRLSATPNAFSGISPILASGGLDASLVLAPCATAGSAEQQLVNPIATSVVSTFEDAYHRRLAYPTGVSPAISVARSARLVVCRRETSLSLWRIRGKARIPSTLETDLRAAEAMDVDSTEPTSVNRSEEQEEEVCGYERLLDMELDTMTNLSSSAVSDDGRWLAVSDAYEIKLFELLADTSTGGVRPRRVKSFMTMLSAYLSQGSSSSREPEGASVLEFAPDGCRLVLALMRSSLVLVVDLTGRSADGRPEPRFLRKFEHHARREALFVHRRIMRGMPERTNGVSRVNGSASLDVSESEEDGSSGTDAEMMDNQSIDRKEGSVDEIDEDGDREAVVIRIGFSPDGQWFATTDVQCRTHIFNLDAVQHHTVLPTSPALVTALAFSTLQPSSSINSSNSTFLILAHADSTIGVFDVEARRFAPWAEHLAQQEHLPRRWTSLHDSVLGIAIEPPFSPSESTPSDDGGRHVLFWGATWLCRVELDAPVGWGGFVKKRRHDGNLTQGRPELRSKSKIKTKDKYEARISSSTPASNVAAGDRTAETEENLIAEDDDDEIMSNFKLVSRYRPILKVDFLDAGELLIIERPLLDILRELPPAFFKPRYGT